MIKAKKLVWLVDSRTEHMKEHIAYISALSYIIKVSDRGPQANRYFCWLRGPINYAESMSVCDSLEEAKASCQAHYQQMVESMVDMDKIELEVGKIIAMRHQIIKDAIEAGFQAGLQRNYAYNGDYSEQMPKHPLKEAQEAFLKKLEEG